MQSTVEPHVTYQLQYRRCGKPHCPCKQDNEKRHGPYWYAFYKDEKGKMRSRYIGKSLSVQQQGH